MVTKLWTSRLAALTKFVSYADGKMMVIGGMVSEGRSASVILYDPQTDTWADGQPLLAPRRSCRAFHHDGAVIVNADNGGGASFCSAMRKRPMGRNAGRSEQPHSRRVS